MQRTLTVLMAQINPIVGAIENNADKIIRIIHTHQCDHDLIVFPELVLTGYPPEDLLLRPELHERVECALIKIKAASQHAHVIIGHPSMDHNHCYNTASIFHNSTLIARYHKQHLPNYGVFDEQRYFTKGAPTPCVITLNGYRLGIAICEDIWHSGPVEQLVCVGIDVLITLNASPFDHTKQVQREILLRQHAQNDIAIIYVNQVGGQDEWVFDGQSMAMDRAGRICTRTKSFEEQLQTVRLIDREVHGSITPLLEKDALIYQALVCGLRDYVEKNRFPGVLLGLSGGVDSALTLSIAVDALGPARVTAVMMPSRYTLDMSREDAQAQANTLGVSLITLPIEPAFHILLETLRTPFKGLAQDTTEENLQARIRGVLLMALSNKLGNLVLATSNKSESAVGYATLYGDMCGGFSVLKDVLKTTVYALAHYRNTISPVIPERVLTRAPTAELALNQTDQDTLPDYAILDDIITRYMEEKLSVNDIVQAGFPVDVVSNVIKRITQNEYKRRQSALGVKISPCAFGRDWRYPVTSGFSG